MPINKLDDILKPYASLLGDVKRRMGLIQWVTTSVNPRLDGDLRTEVAWLQLRLSIETVAIGLLVVHGDIPATQKGELKTSWKPAKIFAGLESLHPDFFPVPVELIKTHNTCDIRPLQAGFLTKKTLLGLWDTTGVVLHAGSLLTRTERKAFLAKSERIPEACAELDGLLGVHMINPRGFDSRYLVQMGTPPAGHVTATVIKEMPAGG